MKYNYTKENKEETLENKVRYQYCYFIYPYKITNNKSYIYSLLKNKKFKLNLLEKDKEIELHKCFSHYVRDYYFNTLQWSNEQKKAFNSMNEKLKANILAKQGSCYFSYSLENQIHGKIGENKIYFTIDEIVIACMASKNCFLILKTHIENIDTIREALDFNYKFRNLSQKLNEFDKIFIQSTQFDACDEIQTLITSITNKVELDLPYIHSYVCLDEQDINSASLDEVYEKYQNIEPAGGSTAFSAPKKEILNTNYLKLYSGRSGNFLLTSSVKNENYTKVPHIFETTYLYTYLIFLDQKYTLESILENNYKTNEKWEKIFIKNEITLNEEEDIFYKKLKEIWNIENLEKSVIEHKRIKYQQKEKKWNIILGIILLISILLNLYNLYINIIM